MGGDVEAPPYTTVGNIETGRPAGAGYHVKSIVQLSWARHYRTSEILFPYEQAGDAIKGVAIPVASAEIDSARIDRRSRQNGVAEVESPARLAIIDGQTHDRASRLFRRQRSCLEPAVAQTEQHFLAENHR
jgi:hypothetical protein